MQKTLNVPAAIVLATTIVSFLAAVVAALVLVPAATWTNLAALPWSTLITVGLPLLISAIAAIRQSWHGPVMTMSTTATTPPKEGNTP